MEMKRLQKVHDCCGHLGVELFERRNSMPLLDEWRDPSPERASKFPGSHSLLGMQLGPCLLQTGLEVPATLWQACTGLPTHPMGPELNIYTVGGNLGKAKSFWSSYVSYSPLKYSWEREGSPFSQVNPSQGHITIYNSFFLSKLPSFRFQLNLHKLGHQVEYTVAKSMGWASPDLDLSCVLWGKSLDFSKYQSSHL